MSDFDEFWRLYPRKQAKLDAEKAWKQVTRKYAPAEIIAGLQRNLQSIQAKERQFQKLPAGWLRDGRWMDEPEEQRPRIPTTGNLLLDSLYGRHH
jgi:hypothetical protein